MSQKRTTEQRLKVRAFARETISIGRDRLIRQIYRHEVLHGAKPISAIAQRAATRLHHPEPSTIDNSRGTIYYPRRA